MQALLASERSTRQARTSQQPPHNKHSCRPAALPASRSAGLPHLEVRECEPLLLQAKAEQAVEEARHVLLHLRGVAGAGGGSQGAVGRGWGQAAGGAQGVVT